MASEVIISDAFRNIVPVSQDALHAMHIKGIVDIPDLLSTGGYRQEDPDSNAWISTVVRTDVVGVAKQVGVSVYKEKFSLKFRARRIFNEAPQEALIRLQDLNLHDFEFPPSSAYSSWISSKDLTICIMKGSSMAEGTYTQDEYPGINVGEACFQLVISPAEDVNQGNLSLVAMPVSKEAMSSLPGAPTGLAAGYPVVEAFHFSRVWMTGIQSPVRQDGFPWLPVILNTEATPPIPDVPSVKKAVYGFWTTTMDANMMTIADWHKETAGPAAPSTDQGRTTYTWPELREVFEDNDLSEAESGKYIVPSKYRN